MQNLINFFLEAGKIKRMKQRGLVFRGVNDPVTVAAHSFREALMGWVLSKLTKSKLNTEKIFKLSLLHDLCTGYAGDITPYDPVLPTRGNPKKELFETWPRFSRTKKEKNFLAKQKIEQAAAKELISKLPPGLRKEMKDLLDEYTKGLTKEVRFIQQLDVIENLMQALEYWQEDKEFPIEAWWHQIKELTTEPILLELLKELDKKFHQQVKK